MLPGKRQAFTRPSQGCSFVSKYSFFSALKTKQNPPQYETFIEREFFKKKLKQKLVVNGCPKQRTNDLFSNLSELLRP